MQKVKLSELCKMQSGGTPSRRNPKFWDKGNIPWAKISDLETSNDGYIYNTVELITDEGLKSINNRFFKKDTLLLAMYGSVGKTAISKIELTTNQAILGINILDDDKLLLKYLKYWFSTIKNELLNRAVGVALQNISLGIVKDLEIPLPSLSTQKTIAAKLDKAQEIISYNKHLLEKYDQLTQSLFIDMFGSGNPKRDNWEEVKIENVVKNAKGSMRSGPFGSDLLHSEFVEIGIPVLGIDNAVLNKFQWKQRRYITDEKYQKLKRYTVYPKDIIITIMGTVGRVAVVPDNIGIAINTKHLAAISLNQKIANPEFIAFSLRSDHNILSQINQKGKGAIMTGLNLTIIKELKLKLPPIQLQNQFSESIEKIEIQKQMAQETLAKSEQLFQSLLKESFN